jgi:UDP-N-acetylglucosamine acyltransferase
VSGPAIHGSALIDPAARLGQGVRIGPWSLVGPDVELGDGTEVGAHAVLEGRVVVGARCRIGHGAIIGAPPQDLKFRAGTPAGVRIGDDTVIREYATIHHATRENGDTVIGRPTVGGMTGLHPFGRIGTLAYVGGGAKVNQDVPPFVIADGCPAVARAVNVIGMRRAGFDATARRQAQEAFRILYRSGLSPGAAVERLRTEMGGLPLAARMAEFVAASRLGIVAASRRRREATEAPSEEPVW